MMERWADPLEWTKNLLHFDRMYLGEFHRTAEPDDRFADPDYRYFVNPSRYSPTHFHSLNYFRQASPPETTELNLSEHLETPFDFYVYLTVSSVRVKYADIAATSRFTLYSGCKALPNPIELSCLVIPAADSTVPGRPDADLSIHYEGSWGPVAFNILHIPVFLRVDTAQLATLREAFADQKYTTLLLNLRHSFPRVNQVKVFTQAGVSYARVEPTDEHFETEVAQFLIVRDKTPTTISFLVASDLHVSEAHDRIETRLRLGAEAGLEECGPEGLPPAPAPSAYCNPNEQVRELVKRARQHWLNGEIDYVVLNGDLIDYAWPDSRDLQVEVYPGRGFVEDPMAFRMGEDSFDLRAMLLGGRTMPGDDFFTEDVQPILDAIAVNVDVSDEIPGSIKFFAKDDFSDADNWQRALDCLHRLRNDLNVSNWEVFRDELADLFQCVATFLVPGNHDYMVFGPDLVGMEEERFNEFMDAILTDVGENDPIASIARRGVQLASYQMAQTPSIAEQMRILAALQGSDIPEYQEAERFHHLGLVRAQAECYDERFRSLRSYYRFVLAGFHAEDALTGISSVGARVPTGGARFAQTARCGAHTVGYAGPYRSGSVRLAFFDNGPNYNLFVNATPWVRGFPSDGKKGEKPLAITKFQEWRDDEATLVAFLHAPPFSLYGPHVGRASPPPRTLTDIHRPGTFAHGWKEFMETAAPTHHNNQGSVVVDHTHPLLVFSGHTHWRHTYSLAAFDVNEQPLLTTFTVGYESGNGLLDDAEEGAGLNDRTDAGGLAAGNGWWHPQQAFARALFLHTGAVGPIPGSDEDLEAEASPDGTRPSTPPAEAQGYYIVTVDQGIVTRITWHSLWYQS